MSKKIVDIEGFEVLQRKIKKLGNDKDKKREVLNILRQVAKPTVNAARSLAPQSSKPHRARKTLINPGNLKKSIGTITGKKGNAKINPTVYVGPRVKGKWDGWYGAMVEGGHNVYRKSFKRSSHKAGSTKRYKHKAINYVVPDPFMEKAYKQKQGRVTAEAEKRVAKFIQRRINKLSN